MRVGRLLQKKEVFLLGNESEEKVERGSKD
jgi:hypothetical protein